MADNVTVANGQTSGFAADTDFKTDEVAGSHIPASKIVLGANNSDDGYVSSSTPMPVSDAGGSLTVDGTVTANLSATDNAVLDTIETNTDFGTVTGGGTQTGALRVTMASDSASLSVDDNGGSLTIDNAGLTELAAAINSNELDINIASDSVGIGGGTQYTEDAAAAANPVGNATILVRDDTPGAQVSADGDNVAQRGTNFGAAYCQIVDSSGNFVDSFGGSGGTAAADDADFTAGTTQGTLVQGVYESSPTSVTDGDMGAVGITATRALKVEVQDVISGGGTQYAVDAAAGSTPTGTLALATRDDALSSLTPVEGDAVQLRVDANGGLWVTPSGTVTVDLGANNDVTIEGGAVLGTDGAAGPANALSVGGTESGGNFQEVRVDSDGHLQVDVLSGGGGGTQYTLGTDTYTETSTVGTAMAAVRNDTLAALANTDNELAPLQVNATGALYIQEGAALDVSAATVPVDLGTNNDVTAQGEDADGDPIAANPFVIAGDDSGNVKQLTCDSNGILDVNVNTGVFIDDTSTHSPNSTRVFGMGAVATPTDTTVNANDIGMPAMSTDRRLHTDTQIVGTDAALDVSAATVTVDNGGTFAVQVNGAALTALQLIDNAVVTEDAAAAANPDGNMMMAVRDDEVGSTAVTSADGDVTALRTDKFGALKTTQLADATSEIKYAVIDDASSGDNTLVAAAGAGVKIRVLSAMLVAAGDVDVRFESGAGGTALTGQMDLTTNSGFTLPFNPGGWFETADNALLNLELSGAVSVDGCLSYVEV